MTLPSLWIFNGLWATPLSQQGWWLMLVSIQLALLLTLTSCARINTPQGWAGGEILENTLYIGTGAGDFRAIETATGELIWQFDLRGEEQDRAVYGRPMIHETSLYFGGFDGHVYALDLEGRDIWDARIGNGEPIVGSPVLSDGLLIAGSSDGYLYALDPSDGSVRWSFKADNKIWSGATVRNGLVYFSSLDHTVYALNLRDGSEVWRFKGKGAFIAKPIVINGHVYIGSFDSVFYALSAETGEVFWSFNGASGWYWADPIVTKDTVYAPSLDGTLYAISRTNGNLKWKSFVGGPIIGAPLTIGERIAIPSANGRLVLIRTTDGVETGQCNVGEEIRGSLTVSENMVFFAASDKTIRALRIKPNGNPDEEWIHHTDKEDPVPNDWIRAC